MRNRKSVGPWAAWVLTLATASATVGLAMAQEPAAKSSTKPAAKRKGGQLAPGGARGKAIGKEADPLAGPDAVKADAVKADAPLGTFHYSFKLYAADRTPLAAMYYPSRLGTGASIVLLVHEKDRSTKDFEDKVAELDDLGLTEGLQKQGYAVLAIDLRGHGANPRRALSTKDWRLMVADLQSAYLFLVDRHNRGELNLSRLGVLAVGEGANLATIWASLPGGGVSAQGRATDIGAMVLVSPMIDEESQGLRAQQPITALAPRIPLCLLAGERDAASVDLVKAAKPAVTRVRANKVELFPSSLHGFKLLRLEPGITNVILRFFDGTIKARAEEWEPRYNLDPVAYSDIKVLPNTSKARGDDAPKARPTHRRNRRPRPHRPGGLFRNLASRFSGRAFPLRLKTSSPDFFIALMSCFRTV